MDVADGMLYLHTRCEAPATTMSVANLISVIIFHRSPPIIHRDLKSHNIFITEPTPGHLVAKIGDWGSARAIALTGSQQDEIGVLFLLIILIFS